MIGQRRIRLIVKENLVFYTVYGRQGIHLLPLASRNKDAYDLYAGHAPGFCAHLYLVPYFKAIGLHQPEIDHSPFFRALCNQVALHQAISQIAEGAVPLQVII